MGNADKSTSSFSMTISWQGGFLTTAGDISHKALSILALESVSFKPLGGSGSFKLANIAPISRNFAVSLAPIPNATRSVVPNKFAKTGKRYFSPFCRTGLSNNKAAPPCRNTRSAISVISKWGDTG